MPQRFLAPERSGSALPRRKHILAYGDSLTAGYWDEGDRFWPYGATLTEGLLPDIVANVSVCGLSSLTAAELLEGVDSLRIRDGVGRRGVGLRRALQDNGSFDLVLIMAGTNDLGEPNDPHSIFEDICALHKVCHAHGVDTVALSVPPSGAVLELKRYRKRWGTLNSLLNDWVVSKRGEGVRLFVDTRAIVPFVEGSDLWEEDNLHLSKAGSTRLGAGLVPLLKPLLAGGPGSMCSQPEDAKVQNSSTERLAADALGADAMDTAA